MIQHLTRVFRHRHTTKRILTYWLWSRFHDACIAVFQRVRVSTVSSLFTCCFEFANRFLPSKHRSLRSSHFSTVRHQQCERGITRVASQSTLHMYLHRFHASQMHTSGSRIETCVTGSGIWVDVGFVCQRQCIARNRENQQGPWHVILRLIC